MAQQSGGGSAASLRALTYCISSTPPPQLPQVAPQVAAAIWDCRHVLSSPSQSKQANEASTAIHRFKAHLTALLQDRTVGGRWSAVVLVKATVEAGGLELLSTCNTWVRHLLAILKKPDPPTTRCLAVLTLARIFVLTWDHSNLVREITTPALTAFVPTCIANIENIRCSSLELQAVLDVFCTLLPKHPTIFRTNEVRLRTFLATLLSSRSSNHDHQVHYSEPHQVAARKALVLLHTCAPKQSASQKWEEVVQTTIVVAHATCDRVFRAVHEDWQSSVDIKPSLPQNIILSGDVELESDDLVGLKPWKGVFEGGERLVSLLKLIQSHLDSMTQGTVSVRLGLLSDLLGRIFGIIVPQPGKQDFVKFNNQISKDEREAMFVILPNIHVAAIDLVHTAVKRFGHATFASIQGHVDQATWVLQAEGSCSAVRLAIYKLLTSTIDLTGPSMTRTDVSELDRVLKGCCEELLPVKESSTAPRPEAPANGIKQQLGMTGSEVTKAYPTDISEIKHAAADLLCTALSRLDAITIPTKLRAQMDRAVILTRSKDGLLASVMSPPRKTNDGTQASLIPILAREFGNAPETEVLLRPRMPPIFTANRAADLVDQDDSGHSSEMEYTDDAALGPATDLLHVLDRNSEEPASGSGMADNAPEVVHAKRAAPQDDEAVSSAKRIRASPVAESLLPDAQQTLPGVDSFALQTEAPLTITMDTAAEEEPAQSSLAHAATTTSTVIHSANTAIDTVGQGDIGSDDSDFEMPPLTMEPDTDPEEEDDE